MNRPNRSRVCNISISVVLSVGQLKDVYIYNWYVLNCVSNYRLSFGNSISSYCFLNFHMFSCISFLGWHLLYQNIQFFKWNFSFLVFLAILMIFNENNRNSCNFQFKQRKKTLKCHFFINIIEENIKISI